jgi:hypothetical protein
VDPVELILILALVGYSVWKQSQKNEVIGNRRFKLAIIYAIIGIIIGGFRPPDSFWPIVVLLISLGLSFLVGWLRGRYAKLWVENGRVYSQGTPLTIGLFLGLIALKFVIGFLVVYLNINDDAGMGEIMVMIAIMIAFYAQVLWMRAEPLGARHSTAADEPAHPL